MRAQRPHLLYVAWGYPPCRGGGVYRALATANAFAADGWDVTVLTVTRDVFENYTGTDDSLEQHIDPRIEVVRIPYRLAAHETDLRHYSRTRATMPGLWALLQKRRDTRSFPEANYGSWRPQLERAALDIHRRHPVDLTVATANPHVAFSAAWALLKKSGVPYVMDYRDAWLLDVFDGGRLHAPGSRAARWEAKLVHHALEVWFVNEPIRDWHRALYPGQANLMHVVANGYDELLVPQGTERGAVASRPLVFGYVGTVSPKVPLQEFVDGWRLARKRDPELQDARTVIRGYLGYFLTPRPDILAVIEQSVANHVTYGGPVAKTEVQEAYAGFDVLLLMLGAGRYVTSGKVFEYLATALPIVSVHEPTNAASDVLQGYPLWFPARSLAPEDVATALQDAARAARAADADVRRACLEFAEQYSRERQLSPRITALGRAVRSLPLEDARP